MVSQIIENLQQILGERNQNFFNSASEQNKLRILDSSLLQKYREIFSAIATGLAFLHDRGIIHRDLKPENILHDKATDLIKIADFGFAKNFELTATSATRSTKGTRLYSAPEQLGNEPDGSLPSADIYPMGLILLLLIRPIKDGTEMESCLSNLRNVPPQFPLGFAEVNHWPAQKMKEMLSLDPAARPTAKGLAEDLKLYWPLNTDKNEQIPQNAQPRLFVPTFDTPPVRIFELGDVKIACFRK